VPDLVYEARRFPKTAKLTRGSVHLHVTWPELAWSAVTVGKWRDDVSSSGVYSMHEAVHRLSLLWAYLVERGTGRLGRSPAYDELDPTEKSGVSYSLGMTCAKLLSWRVLGVPWVMHLDRYRRVHTVTLRPGRGRPDLIGPKDVQRLTNWLVVEAKGRTNHLFATDEARMATQKNRVLSIRGQRPWIYMGSAAHFSDNELTVLLVDPEGGERAHVDVVPELTPADFLEAYYGPIRDALATAPLVDLSIGESRTRYLEEVDITIALPIEVFSIGNGADGLTWQESYGRLATVRLPNPAEGEFVGPDGVYLRLGPTWSAERMTREPSERRRRGPRRPS
jgi:hypothetical protein